MTMQVERDQVAASGPGLATVVALVDVVFLAGVVVPHLTGSDPLTSIWLGLPALLSAFTLPLIAYGAVLISARRLRDRAARGASRRVDIVVIMLAVAGFLAYVSPLGLESITALMVALD